FESKYSAGCGACQSPLMKWPNLRLCASSQVNASFGSSGAGPYSMLTNLCAMLIEVLLCDRVTIVGGVASGGEMFKLAFDVCQHATGAEAEEVSIQPRCAQLFFHHGQPVE